MNSITHVLLVALLQRDVGGVEASQQQQDLSSLAVRLFPFRLHLLLQSHLVLVIQHLGPLQLLRHLPQLSPALGRALQVRRCRPHHNDDERDDGPEQQQGDHRILRLLGRLGGGSHERTADVKEGDEDEGGGDGGEDDEDKLWSEQLLSVSLSG